MPQDEALIRIDWDVLFSAGSIVLVGDPLCGILNVFDHIKAVNPKSALSIVQDRNSISLFENAEVVIEVVQKSSGKTVERDLIIQKWKGHDVPGLMIPFLIKGSKIELDTKARVV
jgi:hypothetical protein